MAGIDPTAPEVDDAQPAGETLGSPTSLPFRLDDSYARAVPALSLAWSAAPVPAARLLTLDEGLADDLGLDPAWLRSPDGVALLSGQVPEGVTTVAQAYAGHQFGGYSPRLGDGRALLLGSSSTGPALAATCTSRARVAPPSPAAATARPRWVPCCASTS